MPLRLPTIVSGLQADDELYAVAKLARQDTYVIVLAATPDCEGQHVCSYGTFIGTRRPLNQIDEYSTDERRGVRVKLVNGITGLFFAPTCGAYCSDSLVVWDEDAYHYIVGLKAGSKQDLVQAANSAIRHGKLEQADEHRLD